MIDTLKAVHCAVLLMTSVCALDILLTNDDGWDAPGIGSVRQALVDAGHRVTLVAPLEQQSGRGGAMNTNFGEEVAVVEEAPGIWSVDGTPTDSVRAALDVILHDDWPDLVVSGSNFGPNLGQEGVHERCGPILLRLRDQSDLDHLPRQRADLRRQ